MTRAVKIGLRAPVITLVLAATVIPIELRRWDHTNFSLGFYPGDFAANIAGFIPVGVVLSSLGSRRAVLVAALLSILAEISQFAMAHRDPSVIDVASNVIGAILGAVISARWQIRSPELRLGRWRAMAAAALALVLVLAVHASAGDVPNSRGVTAPGILEAHWEFDESQGRIALDSAGHGLQGVFGGEPKRVAGVLGGAVAFDGKKDYVNLGHSSALRLSGSMTITAWVNSSSFPASDAVIVSQYQGSAGFQLDTTVDRGPRTIAFRVSNACADLVARYGAAALKPRTWYHVAGVYDAAARSLDVYLNGKLDNGFLLGTVTGTQRSSRSSLYLGRWGNLEGYEFAGTIDDVRIYSFALTSVEVAAVMQGLAIAPPALERRERNTSRAAGQSGDLEAACAAQSDPEDAQTPAAAALFGVLVAAAILGVLPSVGVPLCAGISLAAGFLLVPATSPTLPFLTRWMMVLVSLAGSLSVAFSVRRESGDG